MSRPTQRKIALFGALVLALVAAGAYLLRDFNFGWNPFQKRQDAARKENDVTGANQGASGAGMAPVSSPRISDSRAKKVLEDWLASLSDDAATPQPSNLEELTAILHNARRGDEWFYQRARQMLTDPSLSSSSKLQLIFTLNRAATPSAVQLFADLCRLDLAEDLKQAITLALSQVGEYYWDKESIPEAAPQIFKLWRETKDPQLLNALANAMGKMGNADGINYLLDAALSQGATLAEIQKSTDPQAAAALSTLQRLNNPDAVPAIEARLSASANSAETVICAKILASVGQGEAIRYLLSWAQNAGDAYAAFIPDIFAGISPVARDYFSAAIAQNIVFHSNQVKQALLTSLRKP
jgi:hypothetical protein